MILIKAATLWAPVTVKLEEANYFYSKGKRLYGLEAISDLRSTDFISDSRKVVEQSLKKLGISDINMVRYYPYLKDIKTPLIIRHPDSDESVPYSWSLEFTKKLPVNIINYPGDNHNIAKNQRVAQEADLEWFRGFINR